MTLLEEILAASRDQKKGVILYVQGQSIPGLVVRIGDDGWVEMRSQQYSRIVIRLERIDGAAIA
jgi:hypothetical protein